MSYSGDSWGKKVARLEFWTKALACELFTGSRKPGPLAFLSSRDAGDYNCLRGLGVGERALAVDRDRKAIEAAKGLYPDLTVRHGDIAEIAEREGGTWSACLLDFCGPLDGMTARTIVRVANSLPRHAILGVGLMRGREQGKTAMPGPIFPQANRKTRRAWARRSTHFGLFETDVRKRIQRFKELGARQALDRSTIPEWVPISEGGDPERLLVLCMTLWGGMRDRRPCACVDYVDYQSTVPMMYVTFVIDAEDEGPPHMQGVLAEEAEVRTLVLDALERCGGDRELERRVCWSWNLGERTVAAWRAVHPRQRERLEREMRERGTFIPEGVSAKFDEFIREREAGR